MTTVQCHVLPVLWMTSMFAHNRSGKGEAVRDLPAAVLRGAVRLPGLARHTFFFVLYSILNTQPLNFGQF